MKSKRLRKLVFERARGCCEYCLSQVKYAPDPFSIEHIMPRSKGGSDDPDNLAWACMGCNGIKYNDTSAIDPITMETVPLHNPRTQNWSEHFQWSSTLTHVFGRTAIGRATVEKLSLNREGLVNLREVLAAIGEHPPF
ncbi:MAG: HNH endonuclease [Lewinellaceae bacterium]|nr:HNH endonuclease [Lewinellaceae bacterium]